MSAWVEPARRMTPVSTPEGRSIVTSEISRSVESVAEASATASSIRASAPGRVPTAAVMRVSGAVTVRAPAGASTTGTVEECSSSFATAPSEYRPRMPPGAAPTTMYEASTSVATSSSPAANETA